MPAWLGQLSNYHMLGAASPAPTSPGPALQHYHGEVRGLFSQLLLFQTLWDSSPMPLPPGPALLDAQVRSGASSPACGRQQVSRPSLPQPHHHRAGEIQNQLSQVPGLRRCWPALLYTLLVPAFLHCPSEGHNQLS